MAEPATLPTTPVEEKKKGRIVKSPEIQALCDIDEALMALDDAAQRRVMCWINDKFFQPMKEIGDG